ncbi:unnamed protein product, partial [Prorocentrum cordatum]
MTPRIIEQTACAPASGGPSARCPPACRRWTTAAASPRTRAPPRETWRTRGSSARAPGCTSSPPSRRSRPPPRRCSASWASGTARPTCAGRPGRSSGAAAGASWRACGTPCAGAPRPRGGSASCRAWGPR